MTQTLSLQALPGFQALDGCHCVTASFRKVCAYHQYPISEEMLLGLGAGVGFVYWHQKGGLPFLGGRGNNQAFHQDLARRAGLKIEEHASASAKVAERELLRLLESGEPVAVYVDMPYLTYLGLPEDAHFGGHLVVVAGYDAAAGQVLIADMAPRETGYKTGLLAPLSLEQLARARGSKFQPFPPGNRWFTFDFSAAHAPQPEDVLASIRQNVDAMLHPPIKNLGAAGILTASKRVAAWPEQFDLATLRMALWNVYIYTEIGGSGGGLFRLMYARFLSEAAALTGSARLAESAQAVQACGEAWRALARPLVNVLEEPDPAGRVPTLSAGLKALHAQEQAAWNALAQI